MHISWRHWRLLSINRGEISNILSNIIFEYYIRIWNSEYSFIFILKWHLHAIIVVLPQITRDPNGVLTFAWMKFQCVQNVFILLFIMLFAIKVVWLELYYNISKFCPYFIKDPVSIATSFSWKINLNRITIPNVHLNAKQTLWGKANKFILCKYFLFINKICMGLNKNKVTLVN